MSDRPLHASAVAIEGRAVLITGPSGSGKSGLALDIIALGARLVADDGVILRREGERLILSPVRRHPLKDLLASWAPMPDALPEIADLPLQERDSL